jgi:hypothetical protein
MWNLALCSCLLLLRFWIKKLLFWICKSDT